MYKWIFSFIGYTIFKLPGAIIGFLIGSLLSTKSVKISNKDFEINLLALASIVIKADGKVSQKELDFVRLYFVSTYGKNRANEVFKIFNHNFKNKEVSLNQIIQLFNFGLNYESKLQVIHFLFGIAKADGSISNQEINKLLEFSNLFKLSYADFLSIKAMFIVEIDNDYKILEVYKNSSDDEIKKSYRALAKKHHPDKVQHLGEAYVKAAQDKFQKIQKAYQNIKNERGF
ncbi:MAG: TerB family tellurite resistance protein [Flavobacteriaceae bacterium]|nr:TerB family tellurite resistance protein [Flavobacteriaceae bacterium]